MITDLESLRGLQLEDEDGKADDEEIEEEEELDEDETLGVMDDMDDTDSYE